MPIIITKNGKQAQRIEQSQFGAEDNLQQYIYDNPESLPLDEVDENIRLLVLAREFDTESGPIDALGIDKDGNIYVIETKLYKNADKRLVVAQVMDYGASLWKHTDGKTFLTAAHESASSASGTDLSTKLQEFYNITAEEVQGVFDNIEENLRSGNFRFVVLMDKLHDRLKDLILFLNANTRFSIYAVEVEFYKFDAYEIVIPKIFGAEMKKDVAVTSGASNRRTWDEQSFFESAKEEMDSDSVDALRKLYDWSRQHATAVTWGTGKTGSFNPKFPVTGVRSPFTVYYSGFLQLNFAWLDEGKTAQEFVKKWIALLAQDLNFPVTPETRYKTIAPDLWLPKVEGFMKIIGNLLEQTQ